MEGTVKIGGHEVKMRASAATPVFYRKKFGRDCIVDLSPFMAGKEMADFSVFENLAYIMAKRADPEGVPDDPIEWLDQFDSATAILDALPEIMAIWVASQKTTSTAKKKSVPRNVK